MDTNRDGIIQYAEFINAMADWLQEDDHNRAKKRGRVDEVRLFMCAVRMLHVYLYMYVCVCMYTRSNIAFDRHFKKSMKVVISYCLVCSSHFLFFYHYISFLVFIFFVVLFLLLLLLLINSSSFLYPGATRDAQEDQGLLQPVQEVELVL